MKRTIVLLLILALLLPLSACGREEKELEPWAMPTVDTKPTPVPTPTISFGGGSPTSYVWNEAAFFNMADPGAASDSRQETFTHKQCAALFPYNFLPASIFGESHLPYAKLTLQKTQHEVMLDADGQLAEHAYVEYTYLPKNGKPDQALYVMAELCSYDAAMAVYNGAWAHFVMPEGVRMQRSTYYLKDFARAPDPADRHLRPRHERRGVRRRGLRAAGLLGRQRDPDPGAEQAPGVRREGSGLASIGWQSHPIEFAPCCMHSLRSHTCRASGVFREVHAPAKNDFK